MDNTPHIAVWGLDGVVYFGVYVPATGQTTIVPMTVHKAREVAGLLIASAVFVAASERRF
jgi:hypothetical protein